MKFGLQSLIIVVAIIVAIIAAAVVFIPDAPKVKDALYLLALGIGLLGVAHFVNE